MPTTRWAKGQSGNPKGRPPKQRALTSLLEAAGNRRDQSGVARKRQLAELVWQFAVSGSATLPDGRSLRADAGEWLAVVKWLYAHIDGPPRSELALSEGDGGPLRFTLNLNAAHEGDSAA